MPARGYNRCPRAATGAHAPPAGSNPRRSAYSPRPNAIFAGATNLAPGGRDGDTEAPPQLTAPPPALPRPTPPAGKGEKRRRDDPGAGPGAAAAAEAAAAAVTVSQPPSSGGWSRPARHRVTRAMVPHRGGRCLAAGSNRLCSQWGRVRGRRHSYAAGEAGGLANRRRAGRGLPPTRAPRRSGGERRPRAGAGPGTGTGDHGGDVGAGHGRGQGYGPATPPVPGGGLALRRRLARSPGAAGGGLRGAAGAPSRGGGTVSAPGILPALPGVTGGGRPAGAGAVSVGTEGEARGAAPAAAGLSREVGGGGVRARLLPEEPRLWAAGGCPPPRLFPSEARERGGGRGSGCPWPVDAAPGEAGGGTPTGEVRRVPRPPVGLPVGSPAAVPATRGFLCLPSPASASALSGCFLARGDPRPSRARSAGGRDAVPLR